MEDYESTCFALSTIGLLIGFCFGFAVKQGQVEYVEYSDEEIEIGDTVVHKSNENIYWVVRDVTQQQIQCYRYIGNYSKVSGLEFFHKSELLKIKTK